MKRSTGLSILGLLLIAPFILIVALYMWGRDERLEDHSDLEPAPIKEQTGTNGAVFLESASAALKLTDDERKRIKDVCRRMVWDEEWAYGKVAENREAVGHFLRVADAKWIQLPVMDCGAPPPGSVLAMRDCPMLASLGARQLFEEGENEKALVLLTSCSRAGKRLERESRNLLVLVLALRAQVKAAHELVAHLPGLDLTSKECAELADELGPQAHRVEYLVQAIKGDLVEVIAFIDEDCKPGSRETGLMPAAYVPNATRNKLAAIHRDVINAVRAPLFRPTDYSTWFDDDPYNRHGKGAMEYAVKATGFVNRQMRMLANRLEAARAILLLRAYETDHGELPKQLKDLVPDYTAIVPIDAFDGNPLRYNPERRILYSIGRNLKDTGGLRQELIVPVSEGGQWANTGIWSSDPTYVIEPSKTKEPAN